MALIRKANELEINPTIKMLIYGQSGAGKTTLALSASKSTLLFDFDGGINRVDYSLLGDAGIVQINTYQDFLDALHSKEAKSYDTIVIDTGSKMLDYMSDFLVFSNFRFKQADGTMTMKGYAARNIMFSTLNKEIALLHKNVIYVAQREEKIEKDEIKYAPLFGGKNYSNLVTDLDLVGYIEMEGKKRTISFNPTSRVDAKNTCNLPSLMEIPEIVNYEGHKIGENDFLLTNVFSPFVERIKSRKDEGVKFENLIKSIYEEINLITDLNSTNDFLERINSFEHRQNSLSLTKMKLHQKAKALGLTYDTELCQYTQPEEPKNRKKDENV